MFRFFAPSVITFRATKSFVAGWRTLLRKVERESTLWNKLWLCCSFLIQLTTCHATNLLILKQINNPQQMIFVARQVDHAKTRDIDPKPVQRNNDGRQVEGFCISFFAAFRLTCLRDVMWILHIECKPSESLSLWIPSRTLHTPATKSEWKQVR